MARGIEAGVRGAAAAAIGVVAGINRLRLPKPDLPHAFLTGLHAPMDDERTLKNLKVTGVIPPELNGRYLRIGPNPIKGNPRAYHWFLGDGMIHGLWLRAGRAEWCRNRWVQSSEVSRRLGLPRAPGPRRSSLDTVNTNIAVIGGEVLALVEAGSPPVRIGERLETIAYTDFGGTLKGAFSAHPHVDPRTGEAHAIAYDPQDPTLVRHVVVTPGGRVRREEPIAVSGGPSIHDCAITSRYVVILDLPVTFSMKVLIAGHPFPYLWNPSHHARVGLQPREGRGDEVIWCDVDPCYVFHIANAYDLPNGNVVLDVAAHATMFDGNLQGPGSPSGALERWTVARETRRVERLVLDDHPQDFPRIDERLCGLPHRYVYTVMLPERRSPNFLGATCLAKHDLQASERQIHDFGPQRFPGEFVFVPRHNEAAEDDGWLIGLVVDLEADTTTLEILDAQDFTGAPVGVVHIPHRIPPGFHGNWFPSALESGGG